MKPYVICKETGKQGFRTVDAAQKVLVKFMEKKPAIKLGRTYRCPFCNRWHMTTKEKT